MIHYPEIIRTGSEVSVNSVWSFRSCPKEHFPQVVLEYEDLFSGFLVTLDIPVFFRKTHFVVTTCGLPSVVSTGCFVKRLFVKKYHNAKILCEWPFRFQKKLSSSKHQKPSIRTAKPSSKQFTFQNKDMCPKI